MIPALSLSFDNMGALFVRIYALEENVEFSPGEVRELRAFLEANPESGRGA